MDEPRSPLLNFRNTTREKLEGGEPAVGLFLLSGSALIAETLSTLPIDWLMIDLEASPISKRDVLHVLQALNGSPVTPMIRVPSLERHAIEHALDVGAHAVLVPKVDTPEEALTAARHCRFPPQGQRGVNPVRASGYFADVPGYLAAANARTLCMVQIESALAVENAPRIADVSGVDVLFIGCGDLAMSLGQPGVVTGKKMDDSRAAVLAACARARKVAGIFAYSLELAALYLNEGFRFVAVGNDIKALRESVGDTLLRLRRKER
jgi:2-keto-3-deoxy-L-rhamnonate aldolase RhmA